MLAANADAEGAARPPPLLHRDLHQPADAIVVDGLEWVVRQDLFLDVLDQELAFRVVTRHAERRLGQIVRTK